MRSTRVRGGSPHFFQGTGDATVCSLGGCGPWFVCDYGGRYRRGGPRARVWSSDGGAGAGFWSADGRSGAGLWAANGRTRTGLWSANGGAGPRLRSANGRAGTSFWSANGRAGTSKGAADGGARTSDGSTRSAAGERERTARPPWQQRPGEWRRSAAARESARGERPLRLRTRQPRRPATRNTLSHPSGWARKRRFVDTHPALPFAADRASLRGISITRSSSIRETAPSAPTRPRGPEKASSLGAEAASPEPAPGYRFPDSRPAPGRWASSKPASSR